jgi:DNA-binding FadR family transcriptional regulator
MTIVMKDIAEEKAARIAAARKHEEDIEELKRVHKTHLEETAQLQKQHAEDAARSQKKQFYDFALKQAEQMQLMMDRLDQTDQAHAARSD